MMMREVDAALEAADAHEKGFPTHLNNLLRNDEYVRSVGDFVLTTYCEAVGSGNPQQQRDAVEASHKYAREALEAIAEHITNCAENLNIFLDHHEDALDGLVHEVDLIQNVSDCWRDLFRLGFASISSIW